MFSEIKVLKDYFNVFGDPLHEQFSERDCGAHIAS
jgi:hypothetical protein